MIQLIRIVFLCEGIKSRNHLSFDCLYSAKVSNAFGSSFNFNTPSSWSDFRQCGGKRLSRNRTWMVVIKISWALSVYSIWKESNHKIKLINVDQLRS